MWKIYLPDPHDQMFIKLDGFTMTRGSANCENANLQIMDPNGGFTSRKMCPDRKGWLVSVESCSWAFMAIEWKELIYTALTWWDTLDDGKGEFKQLWIQPWLFFKSWIHGPSNFGIISVGNLNPTKGDVGSSFELSWNSTSTLDPCLKKYLQRSSNMWARFIQKRI